MQFTDTDKRLQIYNGNVGAITANDAESGTIRVRLDAAAEQVGREVSWSADEFQGFRRGYAGTIYKGQGQTLDHTYLYHTAHWRAAPSYVALTRQRESAQVFVARETARDASQLAWQMARSDVKSASVAWATREEVQQVQKTRERQAERPAAGQGGGALARLGGGGFQAGCRRCPEDPGAQHPGGAAGDGSAGRADGWLAGPAVFRAGGARQSRPQAGPGQRVAATVAKDRAVQQERAALVQYLHGAYRDPDAAKAQLDELVKSQGGTSTAARLAPDPTQLGPLRGKTGMFASRQAKADRVAAERAAWAIAPALNRIAAAENRAAETYRRDVDAQRQADAVGVPKLGRRAEAAITALAAAPDDKARAAAWRGISEDQVVGGEVVRFRTAVRQRFGDDAVRAMLRSYGGPIEAASVQPKHRAALRAVSRTVHVLEGGGTRARSRYGPSVLPSVRRSASGGGWGDKKYSRRGRYPPEAIRPNMSPGPERDLSLKTNTAALDPIPGSTAGAFRSPVRSVCVPPT